MGRTGVFYRNGHYYGTPSRDAINVKFDNTVSGLSAGTVKDALDELAVFKKKINKMGLSSVQNNGVNSVINGVVSVPATNGSGIVYHVDSSVKTIKVTATGGNVQAGLSSFAGTLPTLVTAGTGRGTFIQVNAGTSAVFDWAGSAGLFYVAGLGTVGSFTVEITEHMP